LGLIIWKSPSFATPLFEYPLLAALHALVLGSLLPLLLDRYYRPSSAYRLGGMFVVVGELVLVTGFLIHPRSILPADGGLMVFFGVLMASVNRGIRTYFFLYWTGLLLSAAMGVVLGDVLLRPVIDPIPFSMIAVHGLLGAGLGFYPLFWIRSPTAEWPRWFVLLVFVSTGLLFFVIEKSLITFLMIPLSLIVAVLGGLGMSGKGRSGVAILLIAAFVASVSGVFLSGQLIAVSGFFLIAGSYAGYFWNRNHPCGGEASEDRETV